MSTETVIGDGGTCCIGDSGTQIIEQVPVGAVTHEGWGGNG